MKGLTIENELDKFEIINSNLKWLKDQKYDHKAFNEQWFIDILSTKEFKKTITIVFREAKLKRIMNESK